jgi:hypothetical protein
MITIRPATMRPVVSTADEDNAFALFFAALYDDPDGFMALVPDAAEPKPVAIAEDGTSAEFEIYAGRAEWWEPTNSGPIGRVIVEQLKTP